MTDFVTTSDSDKKNSAENKSTENKSTENKYVVLCIFKIIYVYARYYRRSNISKRL